MIATALKRETVKELVLVCDTAIMRIQDLIATEEIHPDYAYPIIDSFLDARSHITEISK